MATDALPTALDVQRLFIELKDYDIELGEVVSVCLTHSRWAAEAYYGVHHDDAIVCRFENSLEPEDDVLLVIKEGAIVVSLDVLPRFIANPYTRDWPSTKCAIYVFERDAEGYSRSMLDGIRAMIDDFI